MSEQKKGNEIVKLNIFTVVSSIWVELWIEQWKANPQADQERKGIAIPGFHISWFGPQEIPLPKGKPMPLPPPWKKSFAKICTSEGVLGLVGR